MTETTNTAAVLTTQKLVERVRAAIGGDLYSKLPKPAADILFTACAAASIGFANGDGHCTALYKSIIEATEVA